MRLSRLQKYILTRLAESRAKKFPPSRFYGFYPDSRTKGGQARTQGTVQRSINNLVAKDLLVAFGYITARKWHIRQVSLTSAGRKKAKELIASRQKKLPLTK